MGVRMMDVYNPYQHECNEHGAVAVGDQSTADAQHIHNTKTSLQGKQLKLVQHVNHLNQQGKLGFCTEIFDSPLSLAASALC